MVAYRGVSMHETESLDRGKSSAFKAAMKRKGNEEEGREGRAKKEEELLIGGCTILQRLQSSPKKTPSILTHNLGILTQNLGNMTNF